MAKRTVKKRTGKKTLPFCYEKSFMASPKYIESVVEIYDGVFYNDLRIAYNDDGLTTLMVTNTNYVFYGDEVGEWIRDNLDKCIFVPGTSSNNYAWWVLYDYEDRLFKVFVRDKRVLPKVTTKDPIEYFMILKDASQFVPIVVMNPLQMIETIKRNSGKDGKSSFTLAFPHYLWDVICKEGHIGFWKDQIIAKKIGTKAEPEDVLLVKMNSVHVDEARMLNTKDISYIYETIIWETAEADYDTKIRQLGRDDSYFASIIDKDIIDATKSIDPVYKIDYRKRTRETLLENVYAKILVEDINKKSYRYITCLKALIEWSRGNIYIEDNGYISFTRDINEYEQKIYLSDDFIVIKDKKFKLDIFWLNTYITELNSTINEITSERILDYAWPLWKPTEQHYISSIVNISDGDPIKEIPEADRIVGDSQSITIPVSYTDTKDDEQQEDKEMARTKKKEQIVTDPSTEVADLDVLKEAPANNEREEIQHTPDQGAADTVEVSIEQPEPKYDIETKEEERIKIRNKIMAEFAVYMSLDKNPYIPTEILKNVGDQVLKDIQANLKVTLESYFSNVLCVMENLDEELKNTVITYIIQQFFVYSMEERDTLLFADLGLYVVDTTNTRLLNRIMILANTIRKGLDDFNNQLNNLINRELYHKTTLHYWDAEGNSIADTVHYTIINSNPHKESAIMLFDMKGKIGEYAFLVTDNLYGILRGKENIVLDKENPNVYHMNGLTDNAVKVYGHILSDIFKSFAMGLNATVDGR